MATRSATTSSRRPHRLALYQAAVQHPDAEVAFLTRAWEHAGPAGDFPLLLREDFAGTSAVAAAWVRSDPDRQALAVEQHGPTLRWADRHSRRRLSERADDLHLVEADSTQYRGPRADAIAALNFSLFELHTRAALLAYLKHSRRNLRHGGVLVADLYGGPGAMRASVQTRDAAPDARTDLPVALPRFRYAWEQESYEPATGRTRCAIHFEFPGNRAAWRPLRRAFRYDWRLWSPVELLEAACEAGFGDASIWCDRFDAAKGASDGIYQPGAKLAGREDFVAYLVARR